MKTSSGEVVAEPFSYLTVNVTLEPNIFSPNMTHPLQQKGFRRISASVVRASEKVQLSNERRHASTSRKTAERIA